MRRRIFMLRGFALGVTGVVIVTAFAACAEFGAADPPPSSEGGGADTMPMVPPPDGGAPDVLVSDARGDGPTLGDAAVPTLFAEGFDNGCGMWAGPGTFASAETKPRTIGACRVCPDTTAAMIRGIFTTARRGLNLLTVWVRVTNADGTGFPPGTVTAKVSIPQMAGPPVEGTETVETNQGIWAELRLGVISTSTALGEAATITLTVSNLAACLSVDDLVVQ